MRIRHASLLLFFLAIATSGFAQQRLSNLTGLSSAQEQFRRGKFDGALATLDRIDNDSRPTPESMDLRGCAYLEQDKLEDAAKAFEAGHAIKYEAFAPRIHYADTLLRQTKFDEARKEYESLVQLKTPMWPEYARFGIFLTYLGQKDEERASRFLATIVFPTETPTYYYARAAWAFSHGQKSEAQKLIGAAKKIFGADKTAWFDRALFHFGWIKKKPAPVIDPFF